MNKIKFLSQIISEKGFEPDPDLIEVVKNFPQPKNKTHIQQFLGLLQYNRRYVKGLSIKAEPLFRLLQKNEPFVWGAEQ